MKKFALFVIRIYQLTLSPLLVSIFGAKNVCRFEPTCSRYAYQAIEKYGALKGILMGFRRVIKCHPWVKGGYDPVR